MRQGLGIAGAVLVLGLGICLGGSLPARANSGPGAASGGSSLGDLPPASGIRASAKIVATKRPLQCVPYARKISGIRIYGDAWTWWNAAKGRFARGHRPQPGAVLVLKKSRRLKRGHLAVVRHVVDSRTIIVDQANWLNRGRIHLNSAVRDVSANNDWSAVRVWYTPGARYGSRTYSANGFIYSKTPPPKTPNLKSHAIRQASLDQVPLPRRRPANPGLAQAAPDQAALTLAAVAEAATLAVPLPRPKPVLTDTAGAKGPAAAQPPRRRAAERGWHSLRPEPGRGCPAARAREGRAGSPADCAWSWAIC